MHPKIPKIRLKRLRKSTVLWQDSVVNQTVEFKSQFGKTSYVFLMESFRNVCDVSFVQKEPLAVVKST